jgi:ABC-type proline/glycine betaine transport system substrate-binding protein
MFKQLLEELGYTAKGPVTMNAWDFYLSAAGGEIDIWVNWWLPSNYFDDERIRGKVEAVGFEVKAGAIKGYLVDKKSADAHGCRPRFQKCEIRSVNQLWIIAQQYSLESSKSMKFGQYFLENIYVNKEVKNGGPSKRCNLTTR